MFGQTFSMQDLGIIGLLIMLEGILSIDNAIVLGLLAKRLPKRLRSRALTYGLAGAFIFRFVAIGTASYLVRSRTVKLLGGGYLVWVSLKHFIFERRRNSSQRVAVGPDAIPELVLANEVAGKEMTAEQAEAERSIRGAAPAVVSKQPAFWSTVAAIELTDMAFAIDSILAAIALVGGAPAGHQGPHPKLWVVISGGTLGLILMRFAAVMFIRLLERFPRFETSAYLLVIIIGFKLLADWAFNTPAHPHALEFHDPGGIVFWVFWVLMALCFSVGFLPQRHAGGSR